MLDAERVGGFDQRLGERAAVRDEIRQRSEHPFLHATSWPQHAAEPADLAHAGALAVLLHGLDLAVEALELVDHLAARALERGGERAVDLGEPLADAVEIAAETRLQIGECIAELVTLRGALEAQFGGAAVRALVSALEGYDFDAGSQALAALEARLAAETAGTDTLGRQHVEALRRRLEQDDTAATELLREMRRLSASDANRAALGIIENAVRCYDFEAALDAADKLLDNL